MEMKDLFEYFLIAILPFQIIGLIFYAGFQRHGSNKAQLVGILVPPLAVLLFCLAQIVIFLIALGGFGALFSISPLEWFDLDIGFVNIGLIGAMLPMSLNLACAFLIQSGIGLGVSWKERSFTTLNLDN
jgi:hypothetical protein